MTLIWVALGWELFADYNIYGDAAHADADTDAAGGGFSRMTLDLPAKAIHPQ